MPKFAKGNMLSNSVDGYKFITTNSYIRSDGRLTMGAGIAKAVRNMYEGIDLIFGRMTRDDCGSFGVYNIHVIPQLKIGAFQVKKHFKDKAELNLIEDGITKLKKFIIDNDLKNEQVNLNFPGIGYGGLKREDVLPLLEGLPENVVVWEL